MHTIASTTSLKLDTGTSLQQVTLTLNRNFFCTNNASSSAENKHGANDVSCLRRALIFYVLNADSGR